MNPTIDTSDFTEKQKMLFLTTSVKSMAKIIRHLGYELEETREEKQELERKLAKATLSRDKASRKNKEYRRMNQKLNEQIRGKKY